MWRQGFNEGDLVQVMAAWWAKHGIREDFYRLRHVIIPETFRHAEPFIILAEQNQRERRRIAQAQWRQKRRAKAVREGLIPETTRTLVLRYAWSTSTITADSTMAATGLPRATASKQLARLVKSGLLRRVSLGEYAVVKEADHV